MRATATARAHGLDVQPHKLAVCTVSLRAHCDTSSLQRDVSTAAVSTSAKQRLDVRRYKGPMRIVYSRHHQDVFGLSAVLPSEIRVRQLDAPVQALSLRHHSGQVHVRSQLRATAATPSQEQGLDVRPFELHVCAC